MGVHVYRPLAEGGRYDLILDLGGRLTRVQVKWADRNGDVVRIRCYRCRRTRDGIVKRAYNAGEIDAFAAYCLELDRCYFFPFEFLDGRTTLQLRLAPSRNNQRAGILRAEDFEFGATLSRFGAIAQLEERLRGTQEVGGSSPPGSTPPAPAETIGAHEFRNRFGWYMERAAAGEEIAVTRHGRPAVRLLGAPRETG